MDVIHSGGLRNALLGLGPRVYLEIMGPDPTASGRIGKRPFGIDGLREARLATWVCKSNDLKETVRIGRAAGISLGEVKSGPEIQARRNRAYVPSLTDLFADRAGGVLLPFFIDWEV